MNLCMTAAISWPSPVIRGGRRVVSGLLLRGLIAGVFAGLLAAGFFFLAGEPSIDRAIAYETAAEQAEAQRPEPEIVSRSVQCGAGLLTACMVYGVAIGGLYSLVFALAYGRSNGLDAKALSALLAFAGFVAMVLVPELKYPANPPAIGAAETIGARIALYFALLAISLHAMILAATLAPVLSVRLGAWNGVLVSIAVFVAVAGLADLALPSTDEVPVNFPASVLWNFRLASIGVRALLWAALGLAFGRMTQIWLRGGTPGRS
jgi:Probable cobalt transporter subunit (CbtA)